MNFTNFMLPKNYDLEYGNNNDTHVIVSDETAHYFSNWKYEWKIVSEDPESSTIYSILYSLDVCTNFIGAKTIIHKYKNNRVILLNWTGNCTILWNRIITNVTEFSINDQS